MGGEPKEGLFPGQADLRGRRPQLAGCLSPEKKGTQRPP